MSEEERYKKLIRNLRKGDVFAFEEVFKKYNRKIYSFSISYLKNKEDAEGVVQDVFLSLWRKRVDLKDQHNIGSYLFTITYNAVRKHFRQLSRERKHIEDYGKIIQVDDDSTRADIEFGNLMDIAKAAINQLPTKQKTVYQLSMQEGLTSMEIAKKLGISRRTVENHLHRAKAYLKKVFSDNKLITLLFFWLFIQ